MPLSKKRNAERMRQVRLHGKKNTGFVQPEPLLDAVSPSINRDGYGKASSTVTPGLDADGNVMPDYD